MLVEAPLKPAALRQWNGLLAVAELAGHVLARLPPHRTPGSSLGVPLFMKEKAGAMSMRNSLPVVGVPFVSEYVCLAGTQVAAGGGGVGRVVASCGSIGRMPASPLLDILMDASAVTTFVPGGAEVCPVTMPWMISSRLKLVPPSTTAITF